MLFDERKNVKPTEYDVEGFKNAILHSFWTKDEFNYTSDINDYMVVMSDNERDIARKCMLAISTVEVKVKTMWGELGRSIPKPEFSSVGMVMGMNEVVHLDFYSQLLDLLNLNNDFENILKEPVIKNRVDYLNNCLKDRDVSREDFVRSLIFFTLFIENVSLFSQFAILMSMNKHKMYLKGMSNGISSSFLEESVHSELGTYIINIIRKEYPYMIDDKLKQSIIDMSIIAIDAEGEIIDWIFEGGELDYVSKTDIKNYMAYRMSKGLNAIGMDVEKFDCPESLDWLELQLKSTMDVDFFHKKNPNYTRKSKSITEDDLF